MTDFLQNLLDGLAAGVAYALLALGFTLVFGVMRRLNLSFGPSIMVGAFAGAMAQERLGAGPLLTLAATVAVTVLVGLYVERLCFRAIRREAALASMVSSFAVWMQLEEALAIAAPERTYALRPPFGAEPVELGAFILPVDSLVMLGGAALLAGGLYAVVYRTRFGLLVRAVSQDAEVARVVGIDRDGVSFAAFLLASGVGGVAGYLIAAGGQQLSPHMGLTMTLKGLTGMVLGGMGSVPGALWGGLVLGIAEAQSAWYLGAERRDLVGYGLLLAVLIFRPGGLFGRAIPDEDAVFRRA
jgi:branched-chain amino acid transport system permease protein